MSLSREGGDEDGILSPSSRLKFLCSYGGKILPRPFDGQLKYVGGETRVVSVPRSITFEELKDKISAMFSNPEIVIKYQVFPEDLDTLVSVRTNEDLHYMLEEYDRHESLPRSPSSSLRFRIFLFPSTTTRIPTPSSSSPTCLDAMKNIKGGMNALIPSPRPPPPAVMISSSPSSCSPPSSNMENSSSITNTRPSSLGMHRVRSTPNLGGGSLSHLGNNSTNNGSPIGGGVGGLNINNPQQQQQQQQQQQRMMGYGGMRSRVGVSYRYETCGCGRVFARGGQMCGHHGQRYYYPPSYSGGGGRTCGCRGHMEEFCTAPNSTSNSVNYSVMSPRARMKSIWE